MQQKRVLYVSQEIQPFLPETEIARTVRKAPQGINNQDFTAYRQLWQHH